MKSKETLLREVDALRDLARHTWRVVEMACDDNKKKVPRRHAADFDQLANPLESEAAGAKCMPMSRPTTR